MGACLCDKNISTQINPFGSKFFILSKLLSLGLENIISNFVTLKKLGQSVSFT